jgi:cytochrome c
VKHSACRVLVSRLMKLAATIVIFLCTVKALTTIAVEVGAAEQPTTEFGKQVFEKRCSGCHSLTRAKEGPPLGNVFGRKAGSVPGFSYSSGLKASGITWNDANLERWLAAPESLVPDTDMSFQVASADERAAVVAYLKSLK